MLRKTFFIIFVMQTLLVFPAFADSSERTYQKARDAYYALQNSARKQMYRDQWERVYKLFNDVHQRFPDADRAADALFMCGKTMSGLYEISRIKPDAQKAVELYEEMAQRYPTSSLADDALLNAGTLLEDALNDKQAAYRMYQRLVEVLPRDDMYLKAQARLKALANYAPPPDPVPKTVSVNQDVAKPSLATDDLSPVRSLNSVRYWSNPGYTRIVLDVSQEARFSANYLAPDPKNKIPPRLYVDIENTELALELRDPQIVDDGLLKRIRSGKPDPNTVRVVLDLESIGDYKVFPLGDPWRIVIDIAGDKSPVIKGDETTIGALPQSPGDPIENVLKTEPKTEQPLRLKDTVAQNRLRRIVVDAGHGGKDPVAVGPSGVLEKDVTLALAKQLAKELNRQLGCEVILTRSADIYLPLEERTAIANKVGADLFISLHANANKSRNAYGIETYYLNFSKNDKAAAVAARENGTSLKGVSDLELILFDLMANAKINESSRLAAEIQKNLVHHIGKDYSNVRDLGVRQGPFYVLLGATMPSVLVETAFISHPREEKRLVSSAYQKSAAKAIAQAVKNYAINNNLIASR